MIGNDIIDLALARKESNWKRKGFLEKLFTPLEQKFIWQADDTEIMIWNLWSRKEAAYKIYNRQTKIRAFIPKQLECFDCSTIDGCGKVTVNGNVYYTKTEVTSEYIYSTAVVYPEDFNHIQTVNANNIKKDINGFPFHHQNNNPVSKTHHGRFEKCIQIKC